MTALRTTYRVRSRRRPRGERREMLDAVEPRTLRQERTDLAERILTCALHLSGLERGAIALWIPEVAGKTRFRLARSHGFEREAMPILVRLLAQAVKRPMPRGFRGQLFAYTSAGTRRYVGGGATFPLVAEGRVVGAIVLEAPDRLAPLGCYEARHVLEFVTQGARLLAETLPGRRLRAG